jgi:hypothetical protein
VGFAHDASNRRHGLAGLRQKGFDLAIYENGVEGGRATDARNTRLRARGRNINLSLQFALGANNSHRLTPGSTISIFKGIPPHPRFELRFSSSEKSIGSRCQWVKLEAVTNFAIELQANSGLTTQGSLMGGGWQIARVGLEYAQKDIKTSTLFKQAKTSISSILRILGQYVDNRELSMQNRQAGNNISVLNNKNFELNRQKSGQVADRSSLSDRAA